MSAYAACRRCFDCEGQEHHWIEAGDRRSTRYECKHCPAQCYAVDDLDDPGGGFKPSGAVIEVTAEMQAALEEVIALIDKHAGALATTDAARWFLEEVESHADLKLVAIEDGEVDDDDDDDDDEATR